MENREHALQDKDILYEEERVRTTRGNLCNMRGDNDNIFYVR